MSKLREDEIHFAVRNFLRNSGWQLIAGQYPNGSDDELPSLNIMDPELARDNSPDHRRHSKNKLVPDLIGYKEEILILIEMKPEYSKDDEMKLEDILIYRKEDLITSLADLVCKRGISLSVPIDQLIFVPCLGFSFCAKFSRRNDYCYFLVKDLYEVTFEGNSIVPQI